MEKPKAILIAGPTASGKSALALRLARAVGGVVVNADSMQVYDGLRILSARPGAAEMEGVEHRLYGHVDPAAPYSAGHWLREMTPLLKELGVRGLVPVICGGTGLYFKALLGGFDDLPPVPDVIRDHWRTRGASEAPDVLHRELAARDPEAARAIRPSDPTRIVRALELNEATGQPLAALRRNAGQPLLGAEGLVKLVVAPDRAVLRARIADRFDAMLEDGAMAEALAFRARGPDAVQGLAAQAIGLRELLDHADGRLPAALARERAVTRTRQYAKRQETWFRNQFGLDWHRLEDPRRYNLGA
ncbi:tRNA (adenosine(37)-N6)-dimethylallyltransferase MiaA [Aureimonas phyllosphaerae]|uniref:tRNA dimethylallyltransferase n=1 Tax=Aureimonas phyllosphaerae TaxID=1166078 RepID=A0A7W6BR83_9HYPH|nr:tRNA (adenosine(37)-N6)-dimethylallyltransferase MiaA [Aureimonas phyllosphaerae]MBB3936593.1 tRNA dimethylallyltransferase [Aureimonas phyllosphaerae]MBB3960543.1 tRNA dimethylallyltransferase [Aureimonas phyllosphaerae]SFF24388.1 tRNA dimethylallyltransferase [Aureimonas phyllosphaerae]